MTMHVTFLMRDKTVLYGAEYATLDLGFGLANSEQTEISVITFRDARRDAPLSALQKAFRDRGIPCNCVAAARGFCPSLIREIRSYVSANSVDCLHLVGYQAAVHGALAARFGRDVPCIHTVHGWLGRPEIKERFYAWLDLQMLKRAQRVVVLSDYYRRRLIDLGVPPERLVWIPSGLDVGALQIDPDNMPFGRAGCLPTVGILGRLSTEKNHSMFLRVAWQLLHSGQRARFLIAGEGPEYGKVQRLVRKLNLERWVDMPGFLDRDEFFRRIDILTLCSRIENLPYVILEAMAWSRPVVATDVGGVADLVHCGSTGLLVKDRDVAGMAMAVGQLLADIPQARTIGRAGRQLLERCFNLEQTVAAHLQLYRELLRSRPSVSA